MIKFIAQLSILALMTVFWVSGRGAIDRFEAVKNEYAAAKIIKLDIEIVVVSQVFGNVDTARGEISIADDGRYLALINEDYYLFDGKCVWEYSAENNQATKECLKEGEHFENRLFFIKSLDHYYSTFTNISDSVYRLIRIKERQNSLPDTLIVYLSNSRLSSIEYLDLNDDLNRISILRETLLDTLAAGTFQISLPDSVEIITLP